VTVLEYANLRQEADTGSSLAIFRGDWHLLSA